MSGLTDNILVNLLISTKDMAETDGDVICLSDIYS